MKASELCKGDRFFTQDQVGPLTVVRFVPDGVETRSDKGVPYTVRLHRDVVLIESAAAVGQHELPQTGAI